MPLLFSVPSRSLLGATTGYARNDSMVNGRWVRNALARNAEHLATRNPLIIPGKNLAGRTVRNSSSSLRLWTTRFKVGMTYNELVVNVQLLPTDTTAGSPRWWLEINGVAQADQFHTVRCASGAGTNFSDIFEMQQIVTVTKGSTTRVDIFTDDNCRVVGWDLNLKPRDRLDGSSEVLDYSYLLPNSPIRVDSMAFIDSFVYNLFWYERGQHLSWNVDDPATPIAVSSTSATNTWGAASAGPTAPTQYRNSYRDENLLGGRANTSIATQCWVLGERTAGAGNVIARFIGDNHGGGIDININGALGIYTTSSFTLKPQAAGDCIRLQHLVSAGGTTGNIYAAGCFPLVGP